MKYISLHIVAKGKREHLINERLLKSIVRKAIVQSEVKLLKTAVCRYPRGGLSIIFFVGISHVTLHTWPEYGLVIIEIFLCKGSPLTLWESIKESLKLEGEKINKIVYEIG